MGIIMYTHLHIHENDGAISGKKNPHVHLVYSDRIIGT